MLFNPAAAQKAQSLIRRGVWYVDHDLGCIRSRATGGRVIGKPRRGGYRTVRVCVDGKKHEVMEHRVVWEARNGPVPLGLVIHHRNHIRDDNRPENLEPRTQAENLREAARAGRLRRKVTPEQVDEMRLRSLAGEDTKKLAADFRVSPRHVRDIVSGRSWAWLTSPVTVAQQTPVVSLPAAA